MLFSYEFLNSIINAVYQFFYRIGAYATTPYNMFINSDLILDLPSLFGYNWSTFSVGLTGWINDLNAIGGFWNYFGAGVLNAVRGFFNIFLTPLSTLLGIQDLPFVVVLLICTFLYGGLIVIVHKLFNIFK